jgi:hypothetical protein
LERYYEAIGNYAPQCIARSDLGRCRIGTWIGALMKRRKHSLATGDPTSVEPVSAEEASIIAQEAYVYL